MDQQDRYDIANVILDIIDREKQLVPKRDALAAGWTEEELGGVRELRMQLREVAFALIRGKKIDPSMLW